MTCIEDALIEESNSKYASRDENAQEFVASDFDQELGQRGRTRSATPLLQYQFDTRLLSRKGPVEQFVGRWAMVVHTAQALCRAADHATSDALDAVDWRRHALITVGSRSGGRVCWATPSTPRSIFIPLVGGVKNLAEAARGHDFIPSRS